MGSMRESFSMNAITSCDCFFPCVSAIFVGLVLPTSFFLNCPVNLMETVYDSREEPPA
jgi:hypothetical protein